MKVSNKKHNLKEIYNIFRGTQYNHKIFVVLNYFDKIFTTKEELYKHIINVLSNPNITTK